jgi:hypothetical protein
VKSGFKVSPAAAAGELGRSPAELTIATMSDQPDEPVISRLRTRWAIAVAVGVGIPFGLFLQVTAVPFGPVLLGMVAAFVGAVVVTAVLCILASDHFPLVAIGFSSGVALGTVVANVVAALGTVPEGAATDGVGTICLGLLAQFVIVFAIILIPAGLTASLCGILKWEDKRAREKNRGQ